MVLISKMKPKKNQSDVPFDRLFFLRELELGNNAS